MQSHVIILGRVVGILKRNWRAYAATFEARATASAGTVAALVVPVDRRIPRIRIVTRQAAALANQRIVVNIDKWDKTSKYPQGHYVRTLGPVGDRAAESDVLLVEHDIPHSPFSPSVLACLPTMPWAPTEADYAARADFRSVNICSIDPPGCTDIDDALHCRRLENGNFECGVRILPSILCYYYYCGNYEYLNMQILQMLHGLYVQALPLMMKLLEDPLLYI